MTRLLDIGWILLLVISLVALVFFHWEPDKWTVVTLVACGILDGIRLLDK